MRKIDFEKICKNAKIISSEEALKDVEPVNWPPEVLDGRAEVVIGKGINDTCAKMEVVMK